MEWYESVKPYIALAIIGPTLALLFLLAGNNDTIQLIYPIVVLYVCFAIIVMGMFFWITGRGKKSINGIDWSKYSEEDAKKLVSRTGFWIMISLIVMLYGLSLIFVEFWIGIAIVIISVILMIAAVIMMIARKVDKPLPAMDSIKAISVFLLVAAVSLVPTTYFLSEGIMGEDVDVTIKDDSFTVKAPMFDHTFRYDEIEISYDTDFDKGSRRMGYNDMKICSGKFHNDEFGNYELASYTAVKPCIIITVGEDRYAFNQDSDASTLEMFNTLKAKTGV